ncbi:TatD family hydrolase [Kiritimatiella glycovorans]|uniref:Putative deoxyribonuclease YcfH n=1 Tax=Kiritimatiella glycovorans TaxID=1307763 RepID=A0A0G3EGF3_9BACT|nr:TatD family hydrolase [Kiritimatiella glycovorans]AKJ63865.1 putative deoxyribonuclease YcfH [Kiritimatiella glycovorans]
MRLFDTHVHLDGLGGAQEIEAGLARARDAGVDRILAVGGRPEADETALEWAQRYPGSIFASAGCDRDQAGRSPDEAGLRTRLRRTECVALGEIGLDYHYHGPEEREAQRELFERMLAIAAEVHQPVVIHSREADDDTLTALRAFAARPGAPSPPGVLHCFTGGEAFAEALVDIGFFISFSGIITFRNAEALRAAAKTIPAERLLIETDTPYLAPVPHRGKRNEPAHVIRVAETLAEQRGSRVEDIAEQTRCNAERLFGLQGG